MTSRLAGTFFWETHSYNVSINRSEVCSEETFAKSYWSNWVLVFSGFKCWACCVICDQFSGVRASRLITWTAQKCSSICDSCHPEVSTSWRDTNYYYWSGNSYKPAAVSETCPTVRVLSWRKLSAQVLDKYPHRGLVFDARQNAAVARDICR